MLESQGPAVEFQLVTPADALRMLTIGKTKLAEEVQSGRLRAVYLPMERGQRFEVSELKRWVLEEGERYEATRKERAATRRYRLQANRRRSRNSLSSTIDTKNETL